MPPVVTTAAGGAGGVDRRAVGAGGAAPGRLPRAPARPLRRRWLLAPSSVDLAAANDRGRVVALLGLLPRVLVLRRSETLARTRSAPTTGSSSATTFVGELALDAAAGARSPRALSGSSPSPLGRAQRPAEAVDDHHRFGAQAFDAGGHQVDDAGDGAWRRAAGCASASGSPRPWPAARAIEQRVLGHRDVDARAAHFASVAMVRASSPSRARR